MTCCSPTLVEGHDLENDPVMKDLRENFREEDVVKEKGSGLGKESLMWVVIIVVAVLVFWYLV